VSQQLVQAFPWDTAPRYLVRDRDAIYGERVRQKLKDQTALENAPLKPRRIPPIAFMGFCSASTQRRKAV